MLATKRQAAESAPTSPSNPNSSPLTYRRSSVSWATAEFVEKPPPLVVNGYVYVLAVAIIVALTFSLVSHVPVVIDTSGRLESKTAPIPVISLLTGKAMRILVSDHQQVKKGDPLIISDAEMTETDAALISRNVRNLKGLVERLLKGRCDNTCVTGIQNTGLDALAAKVHEPIRGKLLELHELRVSVLNLQHQRSELPSLLSEQRRQIAEAKEKIRIIHRQKAEKLLGPQLQQLNATIGMAQENIEQRQAELRNALDRDAKVLVGRLESLVPMLSEQRSREEIKAPASGTVIKLGISTPGATIIQGTEVCEIVPSESELVAVVDIRNVDISKVHIGQKAIVKIKALPERVFGTIDGQIYDIDLTPEEPAKAGSGSNPMMAIPMVAMQLSNYKARIHLSQQEMKREGKSFHLRIGMLLEAAIVTDQSTLFKLFLKNIFGIKDRFAQGM